MNKTPLKDFNVSKDSSGKVSVSFEKKKET